MWGQAKIRTKHCWKIHTSTTLLGSLVIESVPASASCLGHACSVPAGGCSACTRIEATSFPPIRQKCCPCKGVKHFSECLRWSASLAWCRALRTAPQSLPSPVGLNLQRSWGLCNVSSSFSLRCTPRYMCVATGSRAVYRQLVPFYVAQRIALSLGQ